MARVVGPLMSLRASGSLKNTVTFRCGEFILKKKQKKKEDDEILSPQQEKFKAGAELWRNVLTAEQKLAWKTRVLVDKLNVLCNHFAVALPLVVMLEPLSVAPLLAGVVWISGYDAWLSFYLTLGPYGWPNYPGPPPYGWVPPGFKKETFNPGWLVGGD